MPEQTKIKVCHFSSSHSALDTRIFYKECASIAKAGYDVSLVIAGDNFEQFGVHVIGAGTKPQSRRKRMTEFARKVYRIAASTDAHIYHFHDPELLPYALKLKRQGAIVIFDCHEDFVSSLKDKEWIPKILRPPLALIIDKYLKHIIKKIDAVITVTPGHQTDYFKPFNNNVQIITNYPIVETNTSTINHESHTIVFAGGVTPQWSHVQIAEAISDMPNVRYKICGKVFNENYLKKVTSVSGTNIEYLGELNHSDVFDFLCAGSIGVVLLQESNNTEGHNGTLGNTKLFEVMAMGLPVICTNFNLWEAIIQKYRCGIAVDPSDTKGISEAIRFLCTNKDVSLEMGSNGQRAVKVEYNWYTQETKLLALYASLNNDYKQ